MARLSEKRILVVDDEPDVREFLSTCLADAGFQVDTAFDGFDALEKIEKQKPDLITLDMIMPRISGIKLMRKLRKEEKWKQIPVIIVTAHAKDDLGESDMESLYAEEVTPSPEQILEKPISPSKLVKSIAKILGVEKDLESGVDRSEILNMIKMCGPEKLKQIQTILE